ncbi:lipid A-modifier LpxR family protein [Tenacibaculum halocynthiae]|uniref:lipid A-modifier LpxR family protein n=1 Tax=Tenacibaculum halocynthiae TaxID=1254437 RepID=UPI002630BB05|nr:lipid A-modifier LpxR family protein [uncultured Tenacibaculum sp.]
MKTFFTFIFFLLNSLNIFSQVDIEKCKIVSNLDEVVYKMDMRKDSSIIDYIKLVTLPKILNNKFDLKSIETNLDCIIHTETITWIQHIYSSRITSLENHIRNRQFEMIQNDSNNGYDRSISEMKKILSILNKRMHNIISYEFTSYQHRDSKEKWVKFIYFDHTNDVLAIYNNDRDLTGASRFEIGTDKFKLRLFADRNDDWYNLTSKSWYTYQTVFVGGEAYTPDLDSPLLKTEESFNPYDRPFASFIYFGWSRHGVFRTGKFKYSIEWKLGTIGSLKPNNVQSAIHRDLTIGTRKPYGWKSQIASGGRIGINYNFNLEYLLFNERKRYIPFTSVFSDFKIGTQFTSIGLGINFSNKNFKTRGGINIPLLKNNNLNCIVNLKSELRYIVHNSMLEGYGIFKRTPDEDPSSPIDIHFLKSNEINRFLSITELSIGLDFKYFGFIYSFNIMSPEYFIKNIPKNNLPKNNSSWNHVGKIGLIFKI